MAGHPVYDWQWREGDNASDGDIRAGRRSLIRWCACTGRLGPTRGALFASAGRTLAGVLALAGNW